MSKRDELFKALDKLGRRVGKVYDQIDVIHELVSDIEEIEEGENEEDED